MLVALLGAAATVAGLGAGVLRLSAIDAGALTAAAGTRLEVTGHVAAVPRRDGGEVRVQVATPQGRLLVTAPEPVPDLAVGSRLRATGRARPAAGLEAAYLRRLGIRTVLEARSIEPLPGGRDGLAGALDRARARAERALESGAPAPAAALLRGFVLGQDDRIDPATVEEFKRSGLAHLLAVSGQNIALLAILAAAALAALGVPLRSRLAWIAALICVYVPIAGAGPSIQRAGVMGVAAVVATLASRPSSRWYALLLAAAATLALNPRASGDAGWQLSFAAVAGILLWSRPLREAVAGPGPAFGPLRRALAEGVALTVAATLATAPLMAHHFGTVSLASLPANLLALPAVAPVMWLGMAVGAIGQLPWLPVEPLSALAGLCAAWIAQVAAWLAAPSWAQGEVAIGPISVAAAWAATALAVWAGARQARRRRALGAVTPAPAAPLAAALALVAAVALPTGAALLGGDPARAPALRISVLDVGQGEAVLVEPRGAPAVLVDAGPAEAGVAALLAERGIGRLGAVVATHAQEDHTGGLGAVLERLDVARLLLARPDPGLLRLAAAHGVPAEQVARGASFRSGAVGFEVLWPPPAFAEGPQPGDPNEHSLVLRVRRGGFAALLSGDAEAEVAPVDPGRLDLLVVAHHGSEDAGLAALLERTSPRLAAISVGADNPYGHPAPATLAALVEHGIAVARTDEQGEIEVVVGSDGWAVR